VPLSGLVRLVEGTGPVAIERLNRQRYVTVLANVAAGYSLSAATEQIGAAFQALELAPGYERVFAGDAKDMAESAYYFAIAFGLTFVLMYVVLAAQFESFIHPVTILLTLPLALPFGLVSLLAVGQNVNLFVGLGVLVLFAVVKKNAILQIDHMNGLRRGRLGARCGHRSGEL
jgi:HAE1 family hydrophobic/amphiphilic exporter-1